MPVFVIKIENKTIFYTPHVEVVNVGNCKFLLISPTVIQTKRKQLQAPFALLNILHVRFVSTPPSNVEETELKIPTKFPDASIKSIDDMSDKVATVVTVFNDHITGVIKCILDTFVVLSNATIDCHVWAGKGCYQTSVPLMNIQYIYGEVLSVESLNRNNTAEKNATNRRKMLISQF
jgi:hypothetical protein